MIANIGDSMNRREKMQAGCGHLSPREIEQSLHGRLPVGRRTAFAQHQSEGCIPCSLLATDLEVFRNVFERGLLETERREFDGSRAITKARLRQELEAFDAKRGHKPLFRFSWNLAAGLAAAAMLAVLFIGPALIEGPGDHVSIAGIDVDAMTYSAPSMVRGAESHRELWARAGAAYNAGDYGAAERIFSKLEQGEFARDALLYRGVSLLMLGRHDEALEVLERSREIADGAAVNYYAGLAALGSGDRDLATRALEEAAASGGEFGERAQTALSLLDTP